MTLTVGAAVWFAARLPNVPDRLVPYAHGVLVSSAVWMLYMLMVQSGGIANQQVGVMAEEWTAQQLRPAQRAGWHVVHDVAMQYGNLDHALIGPGGVLAVETKYRYDWTSVTTEDLELMARQARQEARSLSFRIGMRGRGVTPIVAVWNGRTSGVLESEFDHGGVRFCPARSISAVIAELPVISDAGEISDRFARLSDYVTIREVGLLAERGPAPRTLSEIHDDVTAAILTFCGVLLAMAMLASVRPVGAWSGLFGLVAVIASLVLRRRYAASSRIRLCTTVTTATAVGLIGAALIVLSLALAR